MSPYAKKRRLNLIRILEKVFIIMADNIICSVFGFEGGIYHSVVDKPVNGVCVSPNPGPLGIPPDMGKIDHTALRLQAMTVHELRAMRTELAVYRVSIDKLVTNITDSMAKMQTNQQVWRTEALEQVLADAARLPARLAEDPSLRQALSDALSDQLISDTTFIDALKKALQT